MPFWFASSSLSSSFLPPNNEFSFRLQPDYSPLTPSFPFPKLSFTLKLTILSVFPRICCSFPPTLSWLLLSHISLLIPPAPALKLSSHNPKCPPSNYSFSSSLNSKSLNEPCLLPKKPHPLLNSSSLASLPFSYSFA